MIQAATHTQFSAVPMLRSISWQRQTSKYMFMFTNVGKAKWVDRSQLCWFGSCGKIHIVLIFNRKFSKLKVRFNAKEKRNKYFNTGPLIRSELILLLDKLIFNPFAQIDKLKNWTKSILIIHNKKVASSDKLNLGLLVRMDKLV